MLSPYKALALDLFANTRNLLVPTGLLTAEILNTIEDDLTSLL